MEVLENFINNSTTDEKTSLNASICLGKFGLSHSQLARNKLLNIVKTSSEWPHKCLALEALVKLFDSTHTSDVIHCVMEQLEKAPDWTARCSAARLLSYIGAIEVSRSEYAEAIYKLLETRLSEDPIREVRLNVGKTIMDLKAYVKIFTKISKYF